MADTVVETPAATPAAAPVVVNGQTVPAASQDDAIFQAFFGKGGKFDKQEKAPSREPRLNTSKPKAKAAEAEPEAEATTEETETEEVDERLPLDAKVDKDEQLEEGALSTKTLAEARKALAKGDIRAAFKLAFGKHPEFFNVDPHKSFRWRRRVEADTAKLDSRKGELEQWQTKLNAWVEHTNEQLKFPTQIQNIAKEYRQTGDSPLIGKLIEHLTGETLDIAMKKMLKNERQSPGESRLQKQLLSQQQKIAELEGKLSPQQKPPTPEETDAVAKQVQQEQVTQYLDDIKEELKGHKALKLENGVKRIYQVLRKSWDPVLRAPAMSPDEAADEVVRLEKLRVQKANAALGDIEAVPEPVRKGSSARPLTRQNSQSAAPKGVETEADIFERSWRQVQKKKAGTR
jgi:hypothetical protein